jgi:hypothetical protein
MSFFSEASLAMIPSGYKTSKVYSAIPTSGDGDLTFSRSNDTATRVGPDGLIEKVRTNLVTYSNTFSNADWVVDQVTKTTGQTDPNGGTTAVLLTSTNTSSTYMYQTKAGLGCLSIYAKVGTRSTFSLIPTGYNNGAFFDLSSVTATASGIGSLAKIESVGGGWFRCSVATSSSTDFIVSLSNIAGTDSVISDTMTFAFAQGETGDIATPYIATTSAAVSVGPVANVPRLDYLDSSSPRLLLEPQRTNLVTYSEQINTGFTTSQGGTGLLPVITANNAISPDGYQNADIIVFDAGAGTTSSDISAIRQVFGGTTATYTCSFYAKTPSGTAQIQVRIDGSSYEKFTITNEWQRFTLTRALTGTSNQLDFAIRRGLNEPMNASATIQLWGVQVELGAYATSYIPSLGASVTRGADAASKTGISSLIGQTEGTIFAEINFDLGVTAQGDSRIQLSDGTASNWIFIGLPDGASGNLVRMYVNTPSSAMTAYSTNPVVNGVNKIAFGYKSGSFVLYVNGVQAATSSTTLTMATCSRIDLQGSVPAESAQERTNYKQLLLFTSRLSNDDLASLTTI